MGRQPDEFSYAIPLKHLKGKTTEMIKSSLSYLTPGVPNMTSRKGSKSEGFALYEEDFSMAQLKRAEKGRPVSSVG